MDARALGNYAVTRQRYSQRVLVSVAVQNTWGICATDISKVFLKGVACKDLVEAPWEPMREVNFVLPACCVAVLRKKRPGYEDFDPATEVLHCEKTGSGCNNSTWCLSLKLAQVTQDLFVLKPSTVDGVLCLKHKAEAGRPKQVVIMTKHVIP